MSTKLKACRTCRTLADVNEKKCPACGEESFTKLWKGYVVIIDPSSSEIAKKINVSVPGTYAVRLSR